MTGDRQRIGAAGHVVRYDATLRDAVLSLQRLAYPHRRRSWIEPRWDWMFIRSADRVGAVPAVWVYHDDTGVQGHRGAIFVRVKCAGTEVVAGWLVDTIVLPHLRGRGIGDVLVAQATRDLPVGMSLGQTEAIRALQDRYGWQPVARMRSWSLVLRAGDAFRGRLRHPVLRAAVAWAGAAWQVGGQAMSGPVRVGSARRVQRFAAAHDRLWQRVLPHFECLVVRDASYLNWKYVDQPGVTPRRLEVVDDTGEVRGICIWTRHGPGEVHAYTRGWILDLVVNPTSTADLHATVAAVIADARAEGVDVLEFDVLAPSIEPFLRRTGWIRGGVTRHLRVAVHDAPEEVRAALSGSGQWFLTRGDSDGDHPWWTPDGREPEQSR